MKRIFAAVLALMMICSGAMAEEALSFEVYAQSFSELTEEVWEAGEAEMIQTLAPEESVTVSACLEGGEIAAVTVEFPCGTPSEAVRAAIGNLGWLSTEGLEQAFAMEENTSAEIGDFSVWRIHGKTRDAISICRTEDAGEMVWQPIHGGEKLHSKSRCSGMDVSRLITEEAAELTGWENCGVCRKVSAE